MSTGTDDGPRRTYLLGYSLHLLSLVQLLVDIGQLNKGAWWIHWDPDDDSGQEAPET